MKEWQKYLLFGTINLIVLSVICMCYVELVVIPKCPQYEEATEAMVIQKHYELYRDGCLSGANLVTEVLYNQLEKNCNPNNILEYVVNETTQKLIEKGIISDN